MEKNLEKGYTKYVLSCFSHVQLFVIPWAVARWAPLSMGFSRQKYWSGLPWPSSGDLPDLGIKPASLMSPALAGKFFTTWEAPCVCVCVCVCVWSVKVLVTQSCPTLCNPVDGSLPGCSVYGILQVVLIVGWMEHLTASCVPGFGPLTGPLTAASQGQGRGQEYWSGLLLTSQPRDQTQVSCNAGSFFTLKLTQHCKLITLQ